MLDQLAPQSAKHNPCLMCTCVCTYIYICIYICVCSHWAFNPQGTAFLLPPPDVLLQLGRLVRQRPPGDQGFEISR